MAFHAIVQDGGIYILTVMVTVEGAWLSKFHSSMGFYTRDNIFCYTNGQACMCVAGGLILWLVLPFLLPVLLLLHLIQHLSPRSDIQSHKKN